jgi:hypothetical protein
LRLRRHAPCDHSPEIPLNNSAARRDHSEPVLTHSQDDCELVALCQDCFAKSLYATGT